MSGTLPWRGRARQPDNACSRACERCRMRAANDPAMPADNLALLFRRMREGQRPILEQASRVPN